MERRPSSCPCWRGEASGEIAAIVGALLAVVLLVLFALANRGQPIALDFGVWAWQGDAVYAIYAGVCVGLIVMFVVSLPSDLALRREHHRLASRERDTAVRRSADAGGRRPSAPPAALAAAMAPLDPPIPRVRPAARSRSDDRRSARVRARHVRRSPQIFVQGRPIDGIDVGLPRIGALSRTGGGGRQPSGGHAGAGRQQLGGHPPGARQASRTPGPRPEWTRCPAHRARPEPGQLDSALRLVGGPPVVLKLLRGNAGVGVILAETRSAAASMLDALWGLGQDVLVQEYVEESAGHDIRALVVGGRIVAAMRRQARTGEWRSNIHRGGAGTSVELDPDYARSAMSAARAIGLDVAGVDMLEGRTVRSWPRSTLLPDSRGSIGCAGSTRRGRSSTTPSGSRGVLNPRRGRPFILRYRSRGEPIPLIRPAGIRVACPLFGLILFAATGVRGQERGDQAFAAGQAEMSAGDPWSRTGALRARGSRGLPGGPRVPSSRPGLSLARQPVVLRA